MSVLIIGAGIGGLTSGYHLRDLAAGWKDPITDDSLGLWIAEARSEVGGRTQRLTEPDWIGDVDIDMGGQDVFFEDRPDYADLLIGSDRDDFIKKFPSSVPWVSITCADAWDDDSGTCRKSERLNCGDEKKTQICRCKTDSVLDINTIKSALLDDELLCSSDINSFEALAGTGSSSSNAGTCQDWCYKFGASFTSCDASSNCNQDDFDRGDPDSSLPDFSLGSFVKEYLYKPIHEDVMNNTEIIEINYESRDKILAKTRDGHIFVVDQVVVAVPISQLQKKNIKFVPGLPKVYKKKIKRQGIFTGVRSFVEFADNFYSDATKFPNALGAPDDGRGFEKRYYNAVRGYRTNKNIVTIQGNRNVYLTDSSRDEIVNELLNDLDKAYDGMATPSYKAAGSKNYTRNYADEAFIEMTTVDRKNTSIGESSNFYQAPFDGRIWFVGDYTRNENGNKAGVSGMDAAKNLFEKFDCKDKCEDDPEWTGVNPSNNKSIGCKKIAKKKNRFDVCNINGNIGGVTVPAKEGCPKACLVCLEAFCPTE